MNTIVAIITIVIIIIVIVGFVSVMFPLCSLLQRKLTRLLK